MRNKPKFNKRKCLECKYRGYISQGHLIRTGNKSVHVCCNFASITGITCLKPLSGYRTTDLRGDNYNNCKLFVKGNPERERPL